MPANSVIGASNYIITTTDYIIAGTDFIITGTDYRFNRHSDVFLCLCRNEFGAVTLNFYRKFSLVYYTFGIPFVVNNI